MGEPCSEKHNIEKLFDFHDEKMKQLNQIEVRQTEIMGDVKHIKCRLDNGMSHTLFEMHQWLSELKPRIEHHARIVSKIEDIGWWLSKAVFAAVLLVILWAASNGWKWKV